MINGRALDTTLVHRRGAECAERAQSLGDLSASAVNSSRQESTLNLTRARVSVRPFLDTGPCGPARRGSWAAGLDRPETFVGAHRVGELQTGIQRLQVQIEQRHVLRGRLHNMNQLCFVEEVC